MRNLSILRKKLKRGKYPLRGVRYNSHQDHHLNLNRKLSPWISIKLIKWAITIRVIGK